MLNWFTSCVNLFNQMKFVECFWRGKATEILWINTKVGIILRLLKCDSNESNPENSVIMWIRMSDLWNLLKNDDKIWRIWERNAHFSIRWRTFLFHYLNLSTLYRSNESWMWKYERKKTFWKIFVFLFSFNN